MSTRSIQRIIVRLDAAAENSAAIDTAARLAAHAGAPLYGVFVEDEDLLRLASLPFARQFTLGAGTEMLTAAHVELHFRAEAARAHRALEAAAERHGVVHSFAVVRAAAAGATIGASERDLVVAGALARAVGAHFRVECRSWSAIDTTPGPFLAVRHAAAAAGEAAVLLRGRGPASVRLLDAAAQVADAQGSGLTVLCAPALAAAAGFEDWLAERLPRHLLRIEVEVAPDEPAALYRRISELRCRLLAIDAGFAEIAGEGLRAFADRFACDLLVVR